jgi:O-antigen/teichoic acid export membrane protein
VRSIAGLTAARGVASAVSAVWLIVAARTLPLEQFGDLSTLLALLAIAIAVSDTGLQHLLASFVASRGHFSSTAASTVVRRRLLYAGVCSVALVPAYLLATTGRDGLASVVILGSLAGTAVYQTLLTGYRMLGRIGLEGANEVVSRLFVLGVGAVALHGGAGVVVAAAVYAVADLGSATIVTLRLRRALGWPRSEPDGEVPDVRLRSTVGLALATVFAVVYSRVDIYLVTVLVGADQAGLYAAGARLLELAVLPALVVGGMVLGHVSGVTGPRRRLELRRSVAMGAGLAFIPAMVIIASAGWLLPTLFGEPFGSATTMTRLLAASAVPAAVVIVASPVAAVLAQRFLMICVGLALVANVLLNAVVVPAHGGNGAAVVNLATQVGLGLALLIGVDRASGEEVLDEGQVQP